MNQNNEIQKLIDAGAMPCNDSFMGVPSAVNQSSNIAKGGSGLLNANAQQTPSTQQVQQQNQQSQPQASGDNING